MHPTSTPEVICSAASSPGTSWTFPGTGTGEDDAKALIVGRWQACGKGTIRPEGHSGIEFGANGRWQLLGMDSGGVLTPMQSVRGTYYMLASGQLNVEEDTDPSGPIAFVDMTPDRQALLSHDDAAYDVYSYYARVEPSPRNGTDNPPSIRDGACTLVGTWDSATVDTSDIGKPLSISFDDAGNFVAGPPGADLCISHSMYGTYRLTTGTFALTQNLGMDPCSWWLGATYSIELNADCTNATFQNQTDGCTGGRGYFNGTSSLAKRR